jgi:hypothetical protein
MRKSKKVDLPHRTEISFCNFLKKIKNIQWPMFKLISWRSSVPCSINCICIKHFKSKSFVFNGSRIVNYLQQQDVPYSGISNSVFKTRLKRHLITMQSQSVARDNAWLPCNHNIYSEMNFWMCVFGWFEEYRVLPSLWEGVLKSIGVKEVSLTLTGMYVIWCSSPYLYF